MHSSVNAPSIRRPPRDLQSPSPAVASALAAARPGGGAPPPQWLPPPVAAPYGSPAGAQFGVPYAAHGRSTSPRRDHAAAREPSLSGEALQARLAQVDAAFRQCDAMLSAQCAAERSVDALPALRAKDELIAQLREQLEACKRDLQAAGSSDDGYRAAAWRRRSAEQELLLAEERRRRLQAETELEALRDAAVLGGSRRGSTGAEALRAALDSERQRREEAEAAVRVAAADAAEQHALREAAEAALAEARAALAQQAASATLFAPPTPPAAAAEGGAETESLADKQDAADKRLLAAMDKLTSRLNRVEEHTADLESSALVASGAPRSPCVQNPVEAG